MNRFEERWKACARVARRARQGEADSPPDWWAIQRRRAELERVQDPQAESMEWWGWYGARGVAVASVLVLVCLAVASRGPRDFHPLRPGVEDAVSEVFWLL